MTCAICQEYLALIAEVDARRLDIGADLAERLIDVLRGDYERHVDESGEASWEGE